MDEVHLDEFLLFFMFARIAFIFYQPATFRQPSRFVANQEENQTYATTRQSPHLHAPLVRQVSSTKNNPTPIRTPITQPTETHLFCVWRHRSYQATQNQAKPSHTNQ